MRWQEEGRMKGTRFFRKVRGGAVAAGLVAAASGCSYGRVTETLTVEEGRDFSGIAQPGSGIPKAPKLHERATWGVGLTYAALGYEGASSDIQALYDFADPGKVTPASIEDQSPLQFFSTPHTDEEGVGPLFNQRMCLGCHNSSEQNRDNFAVGMLADSAPSMLTMTNTPVSRGGRQGLTDYAKITKAAGNTPTVAFTLYGDYFPASGAFDPISVLGGPLQHVHAVGECAINDMPPLSIDPNLQGGLDPVTGLSTLGARRASGERAAPPYVARGLMEAVYFGDLVANEDPQDDRSSMSTLAPQPDPDICKNDCISGRHNEGNAAASFTGGDPVIRVGRFGLRGAGTTMLQFDVGGTQGEIGLTSPFASVEQPNVDSPDRQCDQAPDPEISAARVESLRDMIRNIAVPRQDDALYEAPATSQLAKDVQAGATLFGLDLDGFRARMSRDDVDPAGATDDANHGIAADRQLGCVSCHIPIHRTGLSPAKLGGDEFLSNRWAPIFSDLLIHQNPEVPYFFQKQWELASPKDAMGNKIAYPLQGNISRNLADYAIIPSVTGLANGNEFRTPPLMGLGKVGPPFWHDARVFLNVIGDGNYAGDGPNPSASTLFTNADEGTTLKQVTSVDLAILAAIEIHDLPAPPSDPADPLKKPDYKLCPKVPANLEICSRASQYRGEARNTMEKFRSLTLAQQLTVVKFLESL